MVSTRFNALDVEPGKTTEFTFPGTHGQKSTDCRDLNMPSPGRWRGSALTWTSVLGPCGTVWRSLGQPAQPPTSQAQSIEPETSPHVVGRPAQLPSVDLTT